MTSQLVRVLIAVDTEAHRNELEAALSRSEGFSITSATRVSEAVSILKNAGADAIILELELGDLSGLAAVTLVRAHAGDSPILTLTTPANEAAALKARYQGCDDYLLTGQLYPTLVRRAVLYAVECRRAERRRDRAEQALGESEQRYRSLFEQSRDAIYMTDRSGEILEVNGAALELLGYGADELIGRDVREIHADPEARTEFQAAIETSGSVREFEVRLKRRNGEIRWCLVSGWIHRDQDGEVAGYQGIIHDITDRKRVEDQLAHEAFHDTLTGLPNRALFMDRLDRAVARRRRGDEPELAVMFLDLDRFKVVNDSLGHAVGDAILRRVAEVLASQVREEDTVSRIGGDEFAILLDGVDDPSAATHVAERIQERLRTPFRVHGNDVFTSVSIGITFGGADVDSEESLLRDADTAMYRAKEMGPARYQIFDEAMHAHAVTLLQVETDLRLALERREFVVHYQPVLSTMERKLMGFEALVRWNHPSRGLLAPQSFIPVAEDTGMIVTLGEWVLREACAQLRIWRERDGSRRDLFMSVNLSPRQFTRPGLVDHVRNVLQETGLQGAALRLEITESVVIGNPESAAEALQELHDLGVGLCIDDFGTGYSSLSYLHNFPIDTLKIDRSFISRLTGEGQGDLVETIVALARNMGMTAVAEGVETEEQMDRLRLLGPTSVQGFLFSMPLDEHAASALLDEGIPLGRAPRSGV